MTALDSLIRLHRWQVDERRRHLAEIERFAEKLRQQILHLGEERLREQHSAATSFEGQLAYPGYIRQALERQRILELSLGETEAQITQAHDDLALAFQELKRHEIAAANREHQRRQQVTRRDRLELDAIAIENFRRRSGKTR